MAKPEPRTRMSTFGRDPNPRLLPRGNHLPADRAISTAARVSSVIAAHAPSARYSLPTNQLPPTYLGPGAPTLWTLFVGAALTTAYWVGLLTVANAALSDWGASSIILILGGFLGWLLGCWPIGLRWRALRDRLRVER